MFDIEKLTALADRLDRNVIKTIDLDAMELDLFSEFIGVNAPDAKEWYGGGVNVLKSIDRCAEFINRIASPAVKAQFGGDLVAFRVIWSAFTSLEYTQFHDLTKVPPLAVATVIRANIMEQNMELQEAILQAAGTTVN